MITPRRTRLFRVPDLASFRTTLSEWIIALSPDAARDTLVLVPTRAAGEQLRRTIEDRALTDERPAQIWPMIATRSELYEELAARLPTTPSMLSAFEREVVLSAVARDLIEEGIEPPFQVRPGLVAEMLALYDQIRRLGRDIEEFERNFRTELEREQDHDRGAARLLQQTIFLAAAYRRYQARLTHRQPDNRSDQGRLRRSPETHREKQSDEHALRETLIETPLARPLHRVVVTIADRLADPDGLWPADLDLLTRLPGLRELDVVCTEAVLAAGFLERLYAALPDLDEERSPNVARRPPTLVTPAPESGAAAAPVYFSHRDREEELAAIARRVKMERRTASRGSLDRMALVVRRPLPYLYLARSVFADAAIPFETQDTLPLAAEPYAAAVDLVLDAVASDFTRPALLALLRSPHFCLTSVAGLISEIASVEHPAHGGYPFRVGSPPRVVCVVGWSAAAQARLEPSPSASTQVAETQISDAAIAACDFALADARYLGGLDRLQSLVTAWSAIGAPASREQKRQQAALPAARAALEAALALRPLAEQRLTTEQIAALLDWLRRYDRPADAGDPTRSRRLRVRSAIFGALAGLAHAHQQHDPGALADVNVMTAAIRRWLGSQTFATRSGVSGLQIVDAQAVRYGEFDDVQIVGLIDGEWPQRLRRNVLYPASLLALLEPLPAIADPSRRERDALQSGRAAFKDLVCSPAARIRLSTFALENDSVVEPSILLDEIPGFGLVTERVPSIAARVSFAEAVALDPRLPEAVPGPAAAWAAVRIDRDDRERDRFRGQAGAWRFPRVSVSRLERYLDCPFRFFASEVLRLEEQPEDEDTRTPLERGRFLHDLWEQFFSEWQKRGHGRVEPEQLPQARTLFEELCERALSTLTPSEAALERNRLLGSAVSAGIAHRVFAMEAGRPARIVERLLEYPLQGDFTFRTHQGDSRVVTLSAKVDRIDVLADGTLRVIDYKSKKTPDLKQALQLPIYSLIARESLGASRGTRLTVDEALYLSFEGDKAVVPLRAKGKTIDDLMDDAQDRLVQTLDDIAEGRFPPRPARKSLCGPCPYRTVCRLELVEAASEPSDD